jgi:hypothetical protein
MGAVEKRDENNKSEKNDDGDYGRADPSGARIFRIFLH